MNHNMYGFNASSTESFVQAPPPHLNYAGPTNPSGMQPVHQYPPMQHQVQHPRAEMQGSWNYPQLPQQPRVVAPAGQPMPPQSVITTGPPMIQPPPPQPQQYAVNPQSVQKPWSANNNSVLMPKPRDSMGVVHLEEDFSEDFNEAELFQGQPVLRQNKAPPEMSTQQIINPAKNGSAEANQAKPSRYSNSPIKKRPTGKVIEDEEEEEMEAEEVENEPEEENLKDVIKDPSFEPEEEEEEEYVPDLSGSDEDFTIGRKRKPRKTVAARGRRTTRSQSTSKRGGGTRSGKRKGRRIAEDESDFDEDDDDDDYVAVPLRRGQPAASRADYDLSDDDYVPSGGRRTSTSKTQKATGRRGRPRTRSIPQAPLVYQAPIESSRVISDSDEEEIFLLKGQPVSNKRKASKCSETTPKAVNLNPIDDVVFLVNIELHETIKNLPEECPFSDANFIWRLKNLQLQKFQQMGDSNSFNATSTLVQYNEDNADSYIPLSVEFLKNKDCEVVKLFDTASIQTDVPSSQPLAKRRRGRPPSVNKPKAEKKASPRVPGRKRGRPRKSVDVAPTEPVGGVETQPVADSTAKNEDAGDCLVDRNFILTVVKHNVKRLCTLAIGNNESHALKTADVMRFDQSVQALKDKVLGDTTLSTAFMDLLSTRPTIAVEKSEEKSTCEALSNDGENEANSIVVFGGKAYDLETLKEFEEVESGKYFACDAALERSLPWHALHHLERRLLDHCKSRLDQTKASEPVKYDAGPSDQSDGSVSSGSVDASDAAGAVKMLIDNLIGRVVEQSGGESPGPDGVPKAENPDDAGSKLERLLDDSAWLETIVDDVMEKVRAAHDAINKLEPDSATPAKDDQ